MSRWDDSEHRVARARILARYVDRFDGDVLAAAEYLHDQEGWT